MAFVKELNKVKATLTTTRAKFEAVKIEMKSAAAAAERAIHDLNFAMAEAREMYKALQEMRASHEKAQASTEDYNRLVVSNLRKQLKTTRATCNSYNSTNHKLKLLRHQDKIKIKNLKQTDQVKKLVAASEMDAVLAMEAKEEVEEAMLVTLAANKDLQRSVKALHESQDAILKELHFSKEQLQEALGKLSHPGSGNAMNWVEKLGKRGSRYDVMIVEMGIQLMSSELSAAQAVYALTVFMMKTYPSLQPGVDYRIPGESTFKEWAESIYEVGGEHLFFISYCTIVLTPCCALPKSVYCFRPHKDYLLGQSQPTGRGMHYILQV